MVIPIPTLEDDPLCFFNDLFYNDEVIEKYRTDFFEYWQSAAIVDDRIFINEKEGYIEHFYCYDESQREIQTKETFIDNFKKDLLIESKKSKNLIKRKIGSMVKNDEPIPPYLLNQIRILKFITTNETEIFEKYPFCKNIINSLYEFLLRSVEKYKENNESSKQSLSLKLKEETIDIIKDKVIEVLGYLNGNNWKGEKIMSDSEHDRLIELTNKMILNNSFPEISTLFQRIKITNALLYFSFYVLYRELKKLHEEGFIDIYPERAFFSKFIFLAFCQINSTNSEDTAYTKLPIPYGKFGKENWIPEIIRKYKSKVKTQVSHK